MEPALLSMGKWQKMFMDCSGLISDGEDEFCRTLNGCRFADLLNEESRRRFNTLLSGRCGYDDGDIFCTVAGIPLEIVVVPLSEGFLVIYRNIEMRLKHFAKLAVFYRNFLSTPTAICITDEEGLIKEANSSFLNLYGYSSSEVLGSNPRILKSGRQSPDVYREMWRQITDPSVEQWCGEIINRKKNGEEVTVHLTVSAVRNLNDQHMGFLATTVDLTERKRIERALEDANQKLVEINQFKSDLMAITSHDLKSPLNAIISRAGMIRDLSMSPEGQNEQLDKIIESGFKMASFIDELLDLEKMESGRFQLATAHMHLDTLLQACVETNLPSAATMDISLDLQFFGEMEPVRADMMKLEQVFNNIISNAIKYTPRGGQITVHCSGLRGGEKSISIADNGPGIPESHLPLIFDRYYQVRHDGRAPGRVYGAGLGLSIVRNIVELHGGSVAATNRPEGGSTFCVRLPHKGVIRSGKDIAALIMDPQQSIYTSIEPQLRYKGVSCYITRNLHETERVLQREQPELLFVASSACSAAVVRSLAAWGEHSLYVLVDDALSGAMPDGFSMMLTMPVIDVEIFEIIDEIIMTDFNHGE
jgi:PAS domain S-box-containing protein